MPSSLDILIELHPTLPELNYETLTEIPSGLLSALATVPDPRRFQGRRYRSAWLLAVMVCTIMAGHTGFRQMHELARRLTNHRKLPVPRPSTFHRFLKRLDPMALEEALVRWGATLHPDISTHLAEAISIDGKEIRSAKNGHGCKTHLMAATTHQTGLVLGQVNVHAKTNEIPCLPELLELLARHYDLTGRVITLDALHTQRATAKLITETHHAHYVLTLKRNHPTLHTLIRDLPWEEVPVTDTTIDTSHGRVAIRKLQIATLKGKASPDWPGLRQAARLTRERTYQGKTSFETVFILTSLPTHLAGAGYLADLVRGHWSIENKIHHVRDTTYNEDRNQIRTGHAPRNIAALTNAALTALRAAKLPEIRPTTRALHAQNKLIPAVLTVV